MKTIKKILAILFLLSSFLHANLNDVISIGMVIQDYNVANKNRLKRVIKDISQKMNDLYDIKLQMVFYDNVGNMFSDYYSYKKINSIIIWSKDYLEHKENLKRYSKEPFLFKESSFLYTQYYLLANKNSKIKTLKDIKSKSFMAYLTQDNTRLWLDSLSYEIFGRGYRQGVIKRELEAKKRSTLVLDVYFNKVDFSVVSRKVYDDMLLLNPSIKNNVKIVKKSPEIFFYGLGLMHRDMEEKLSSRLTELLEDDEFYERFDQLFRLIGINAISTIDFEYLVGIEKFYEDYTRVKK